MAKNTGLDMKRWPPVPAEAAPLNGNAMSKLRNLSGDPPGVLLVEDDALVAMSLQDDLADFGCRLLGCAATADDAERMAAESRPDIVLMDVGIRGGRDGIDTARVLQERHDLPVIFITGASGADAARRISELRAAIVLSKPFSPADLRSALANALVPAAGARPPKPAI